MGCSLNCTDIFEHLDTVLGQVNPQYQAILCYPAAAKLFDSQKSLYAANNRKLK